MNLSHLLFHLIGEWSCFQTCFGVRTVSFIFLVLQKLEKKIKLVSRKELDKCSQEYDKLKLYLESDFELNCLVSMDQIMVTEKIKSAFTFFMNLQFCLVG